MTTRTSVLLERWQNGDRKALEELIQCHLDWIIEQVHRRLGRQMRGRVETLDLAQDAILRLLNGGPPDSPRRESRFQAFVRRAIENAICDKWDWLTARCRDMARDRPMSSQSRLPDGDTSGSRRATPSRFAQQEEEANLVRRGIELLGPEDREIILLREWEQLSHPVIARQLDITEQAARKRFERAVIRLTAKVKALKAGQIEAILDGHAALDDGAEGLVPPKPPETPSRSSTANDPGQPKSSSPDGSSGVTDDPQG